MHNLEGIVSFGYRGTSPAFMGACAERNISLCFLTPQGNFLARIIGKIKGNVVLRQQQYLSSSNEDAKVWKSQKTVFLERYIIPDGYWNGQCVITVYR